MDGELTIEPTAVVNLDPGGTVRAGQLDNLGTVNASGSTLIVGGTIVVPEPGGGLAACVAVAAIAAQARRASRRGRSRDPRTRLEP